MMTPLISALLFIYYVAFPLYAMNMVVKDLNDFEEIESVEDYESRIEIKKLIKKFEEKQWTKADIMCILQEKRDHSTVTICLKKPTDNSSLSIETKI